eukprot:2442206-Amphidinium_carterae.2
MPPLEAIKTLCSLCVSLGVSPRGKPLKLTLQDISRAHLYRDAQRDLYVELPPEDTHRESDTEQTTLGSLVATHWQAVETRSVQRSLVLRDGRSSQSSSARRRLPAAW